MSNTRALTNVCDFINSRQKNVVERAYCTVPNTFTRQQYLRYYNVPEGRKCHYNES